MNRRHFLKTAAASSAAMALYSPSVFAQRGAITLVCPGAVGGSSDLFARIFADYLAKELNQTVIVENRLGAGGVIGAESVVKAKPDGQTVMFHSGSSAVTSVISRKTMPYDPVEAFSWISMLGAAPLVLAAAPSLGVKTLSEATDLFKANPGKYAYGSAGVGSTVHLAAELYKQKAGGLQIKHIPYTGGGPAIIDTMSGTVAFTLDTLGPILSKHRDGSLQVLAVLGEKRSPTAPDLPTAKEQGLEVVAGVFNPIAVPKNTPKDVVDRYVQAASNIMKKPDILEKLAVISIEPVTDSNPEKAKEYIQHEVSRWTPIVKSLGIAT